MRVSFAVALIVFGFAGVAAVRAADLQVERAGRYSGGYFENGRRAEMLLVYDNEPGVFVRDYWRAPWRNHHYFPTTGRPPRVGRQEHLSAVGRPQKPAQTFRRSWSNASALDHETPVVNAQPNELRPQSVDGIQPQLAPRRHGPHGIHRR